MSPFQNLRTCVIQCNLYVLSRMRNIMFLCSCNDDDDDDVIHCKFLLSRIWNFMLVVVMMMVMIMMLTMLMVCDHVNSNYCAMIIGLYARQPQLCSEISLGD